MLVALDAAGRRVVAWEAVRAASYECPECREAVILKLGSRVIAHYAHRPGTACSNAGETRQHLEMKLALYRALQRNPHWGPHGLFELEQPLGNLRADVWLQLGGGRQLAIECQHSHIRAEEATQKIVAYAAQGIDCVYIVHAEAFPDYQRTVGITSLHGREISVPAWVRAVATRDSAVFRTHAAFGPTQKEASERTFVHVWADGRLWVLQLGVIYRERAFGPHWTFDPLTRIRDGRLLGEIEDISDDWMLRSQACGPAYYEAVAKLAALEGSHPSVAVAIAEAAGRGQEVIAPSPRRLRDSKTRRALPGVTPPPPPPPLPTRPTVPVPVPEPEPQLGLGLEVPTARRPRRPLDHG
jgi:hypothetical protein